MASVMPQAIDLLLASPKIRTFLPLNNPIFAPL
jgi:hypothetical protein